MNGVIKWLQSEPAAFWSTASAAIIATLQADPAIPLDVKNWVTLGLVLAAGLITRQSVSPVK